MFHAHTCTCMYNIHECSILTHSPTCVSMYFQLDSKRLEFESDAKMSKLSLERNLRQLTYLRNLTKTNDGEEPSNCPICTGPLQRNDGVSYNLLIIGTSSVYHSGLCCHVGIVIVWSVYIP